MFIRIISAIALLLTLVSHAAHATKSTTPGGIDHRLRAVDYAPGDVIVVPLFLGYATQIKVAAGEKVLKAIIGDGGKYDVQSQDNNIWVKIRDALAVGTTTNLFVYTDQGRQYNFFIESRKSTSNGRGRGVVFDIQFDYPLIDAEKEKERITALNAAADSAKKLEEMKAGRFRHTGTFEVQGSPDLTPQGVWYEGRETHIRFAAGQLLPSVYRFTETGEELVSFYVENMTVVIDSPLVRFTLRRGDSLMLVESTGDVAKVNADSTINHGIKRVLK